MKIKERLKNWHRQRRQAGRTIKWNGYPGLDSGTKKRINGITIDWTLNKVCGLVKGNVPTRFSLWECDSMEWRQLDKRSDDLWLQEGKEDRWEPQGFWESQHSKNSQNESINIEKTSQRVSAHFCKRKVTHQKERQPCTWVREAMNGKLSTLNFNFNYQIFWANM